MALHKFKVERTGTIFYYNNITNGLYDKNKKVLNPNNNPDVRYSDAVSIPAMMKNSSSVMKSKTPKDIRIVLGHKCNYDCGYCVQKEVGEWELHPQRVKENPKIKQFAETVRRTLDLSQLEQIEFSGGEPMLYWRDIASIIEEFDAPDMTFVIPTNGSLLSMKHIKFLMNIQGTMDFEITHDGPSHGEMRGPEYLDSKAEIFRAIQNSGGKINIPTFHIMITRLNTDLYKLNNFFVDYFAKHDLEMPKVSYLQILIRTPNNVLYAPFDEMESPWKPGDPQNGRSSKLKDEIAEFIDDNIDMFRENGNKVNRDAGILPNNFFGSPEDENEYTDGVLGFANSLKWESTEGSTSMYRCDFKDLNKIAVDLDGRIRTCENASAAFTANHLDDFQKDHQVDIIGIDHSTHDLDCLNCMVFLLCRKGCPYALQGDYFYHNCSGYKTFFEPVIIGAFKLLFGGDVEYLGMEDLVGEKDKLCSATKSFDFVGESTKATEANKEGFKGELK